MPMAGGGERATRDVRLQALSGRPDAAPAPPWHGDGYMAPSAIRGPHGSRSCLQRIAESTHTHSGSGPANYARGQSGSRGTRACESVKKADATPGQPDVEGREPMEWFANLAGGATPAPAALARPLDRSTFEFSQICAR